MLQPLAVLPSGGSRGGSPLFLLKRRKNDRREKNQKNPPSPPPPAQVSGSATATIHLLSCARRGGGGGGEEGEIPSACSSVMLQVYDTVKPVYNGPILSDQFSNVRFFEFFKIMETLYLFPVLGSHLLSGRGHPETVLYLSFFAIFTCIERPTLL